MNQNFDTPSFLYMVSAALFRPQFLQCPAYDVIFFVAAGEIFVHVPDVARRECLELAFQSGYGLLAVGLVLGLDLLALSLGHDTVDDDLWRLKLLAEEVERRIQLLQLLSVVVDVAHALLNENATGRHRQYHGRG